jgi:hypothetical protein
MKAVENRINQYLGEIKSHLGFLSEDEIEEILVNVRSHINDELAVQGQGQPTLEMVDTVLGQMDSPVSYAQGFAEWKTDDVKSKRMPWQVILAAILLPSGIITTFMIFAISPSSGNASPTLFQWLLRVIVLPLGILSPFVCTTLGLAGISQIRNSKGKIIGLPLAFSVAIFYPIIVLDFVLFWFIASAFSAEEYWNIVLLGCILVILVLDFVILKSGWKAARRKE